MAHEETSAYCLQRCASMKTERDMMRFVCAAARTPWRWTLGLWSFCWSFSLQSLLHHQSSFIDTAIAIAISRPSHEFYSDNYSSIYTFTPFYIEFLQTQYQRHPTRIFLCLYWTCVDFNFIQTLIFSFSTLKVLFYNFSFSPIF